MRQFFSTGLLRSSAMAVLALGVGFTSCDDDDDPTPDMDATASINVAAEQFLDENGGKVMVSSATFSDDGWLVVHRQSDNSVIGEVAVNEGTSSNIMISLDEEVMFGETLVVMAHEDTGQEGVYEFDGGADDEDQPIMDSNNAVVQSTVMYMVPSSGTSMMYDLMTKGNLGVSGTATFYDGSDAAYVILDLDGTPANGMHPAHIHDNTAVEGGGVAVALETVDGASGMSITKVTGTSYADLIDYDGYINVHLSSDDIETIVAQGDIGQNDLTGSEATYDLMEMSNSGVMGTATFKERVNGETLVILDVTGTPANGDHPAHIHMNTAAEGGGIAVSLVNVDGDTGMSMTNVSVADMGTVDEGDDVAITYDELIDYDGYINIHLSPSNLGTVVAQGDIGQNAFTGNMKTYNLNEKDVAGISGIATFKERANGNTLIILDIENTPVAGMHPAHIHMGSVAEAPGNIALTLETVDGDTGMSYTEASMLDDNTEVNYNDLIGYDGYINVHLSDAALSTIVAQGDIGSNASN